MTLLLTVFMTHMHYQLTNFMNFTCCGWCIISHTIKIDPHNLLLFLCLKQYWSLA